MESPSSSDIDLAWVQQLEDYVQAELRSRASSDVNALQEERTTFGQHAADVLAEKAGSWTFILGFVGVLAVWITLNAIGVVQFDLYPFILLNLAFSTQAAYAAPLILLAQTRQADRDKAHADADAQHREDLARASLERQEAAARHAAQMHELLEQNTRLTQSVQELSQRTRELTDEIHRRVMAAG